MFLHPSRLFLLLLSIFLPSLGVAESLDLTPLQQALEKRDKLSSVTAQITQEKTVPSLKDPVTTKGKLWLIPQKAFRWEQGQPITEIALYHEDKVSLLKVQENTVNEFDPDDREVRPLMLLMGMGEDSSYEGLLKNFKPTVASENTGTLTVNFLPESGRMKRAISSLTLTLDLKTSFPKEIHWEQRDGSVIITKFSNVRVNQAVDEKLFSYSEK